MSNNLTTENSLSEWLNYLGSLHVSAIDMGLSRVLPVAEHLGLTAVKKDNTNLTIFTVSGTNGKGSTTATISAITSQAGYKTALYQSPHILKFNERIQINNQAIDDATLIKAFAKVDAARINLKQSLSFFEATTLAAMLIFKEAKCDAWVLEIGLGGRLDVVNIIAPDVAVITNIGVDHIDWLGDDKEKIGYEKAGILRKNTPCVLGNPDMPTSVWKKTRELNNQVLVRSVDYDFDVVQNPSQLTSKWLYSTPAVTMSLPVPTLALENVSTAITAVFASNLSISQQHIATALTRINLMGRFYQTHVQFANQEKRIPAVLDALHNPDGARFLLKKLLPMVQQHESLNSDARLHIVFSMLVDKNIVQVVELLNEHLQNIIWHIAPLRVVRAANIAKLRDALRQAKISADDIYEYETIQKATEEAYHLSNVNDKMLICGSFHTIADALQVMTDDDVEAV